MSSYGLGESLAAHGPMPEERGEASETDYRKLCEESLKAAHAAMQRGQYAEAHDHMAAWSEHYKKTAYDEPSPPQHDEDGDDDARGMIVIGHPG